MLAGLCTAACAYDGGPGGTAARPRSAASTPRSAAARRPNIVFVLTDDLDSPSVDLMPKLQALIAQRGVTFQNAFTSSPICCPSRASMLTGQYAHNHGVLTNGGPSRSCFEDFRDAGGERAALPTWLKSAGYRTGFVGKYLNRYPGTDPASDEGYIPTGWDSWHATFAPRGSEQCPSCTYYDYAINDDGDVVSHGEDDADYITDVETARAVEFIQKPRNGSDAPFFLWLAYTAPHMPATPARRDAGAQADKHAPRTASFNEEDIDDKPAWFRTQPMLSPDDVADIDDTYRRRLESMMAVDDGVERIVNALQASGELDNTYVVFTSDNGFLQGQHRFAQGKTAAYEESIRIPLVARGPGIAPGTRVPQAALNIDLPATFAEIAGLAAPPTLDGRSLVPLFSGAPPAWRKDMLLEFEATNVDGLPSWNALRATDSIFVDYPAVAEREYYDLTRDPDELSNSYGSLERDRVDALVKRLDQLLACSGASCRQ